MSNKWKCVVYVGFIVLGLSVSLGQNAWANHYGMAGCGVGALAFQDQPGKIQIVAATLNNIISPQTSALTSGTSGCLEESMRDEASSFIKLNQEALKKDISRGTGETLMGLSQILGCSDAVKIGVVLQQNYRTIFQNVNLSPQEMGQSIESTVQQSKELSGTCRAYI
jgi:hypothetical protein